MPGALHRIFRLRGGTLDLVRGTATVSGEVRGLTTREVELITFLAKTPGVAVSREELLQEVWHYKARVITRTVDVTVRRLRMKLELDPDEPDHLLTRTGAGYLFSAEEIGPTTSQEPTPQPSDGDPSSHPPTGAEVTLLFTDIEGSTRHWELDPEAFRAGLEEHDRLFRTLIIEHSGYEVKTMGDSFVVAFGRPDDAVGFALAAQRRLADLGALASPIRVRIGMHTGAALARTNPVTGRADWFGPTVNRASRVGDAGHGGQVLVTEAVLARISTPVRRRDLGLHQLAGCVDRTALWQIEDPRLPEMTFPAPRTDSFPGLPARIDRFVGRATELARLDALFEAGARIVTLVGPGGTGKTRLALEHARRLPQGRVLFVDLSEARTEGEFHRAMTNAFDAPPSADSALQLSRVLSASSGLRVILDNAEQIADAVSYALTRWLPRAPDATVIVTSRVPLHPEGEHVLEVGPMAEDDAVALFLDRARAGSSTFRSSDEDVRALARALDGWPLALELAAARSAGMPVSALRERLRSRFGLLVGKHGPERHRVMRAVLDSSVDALPAPAKRALAQLSVFAGGWTLDDAEAVLDVSQDEMGPVDALDALREHALVLLDYATERYSIRVTVREYGETLLGEDERAAAERRHGQRYAATLAEHAERDMDNLIVAARRSLSRGDGASAGACAVLLADVMARTGPFLEGATLAGSALALCADAGPSELVGPLTLRLGRLLLLAGQFEQAKQRLRSIAGDPAIGPMARANLGKVAREEGSTDEAMALLTDACAFAAAQRDVGAEALAQDELACACLDEGAGAAAADHATRAVALYRKQRDDMGTADALATLSLVHHLDGRNREAEASVAEARGLLRRTPNRRIEGTLEDVAGLVALNSGRVAEARANFQLRLIAHRATGQRRSEAGTLSRLGYIALIEGKLAEARAILGESLEILDEVHDAVLRGVVLGWLARVDVEAGGPESALVGMAEAAAALRETGARAILARVLAHLAVMRAGAGLDPNGPLEEAEALTAAVRRPDMIAHVAWARAETAVALGNAGEVPALLALARGKAAEAGYGPGSDLTNLLDRCAARSRSTQA